MTLGDFIRSRLEKDKVPIAEIERVLQVVSDAYGPAELMRQTNQREMDEINAWISIMLQAPRPWVDAMRLQAIAEGQKKMQEN